MKYNLDNNFLDIVYKICDSALKNNISGGMNMFNNVSLISKVLTNPIKENALSPKNPSEVKIKKKEVSKQND